MEQKEAVVKINGKGFKKLSKKIKKLKNDFKGLNNELQQTVTLMEQIRSYKEDDQHEQTQTTKSIGI